MALFRIKDWDRHYENNRTRQLKKLEWVPIPNNHDSDGYTTLVDHENGAAHLGAWLVIVQLASKCEPRGTLSRTKVRESGTPVPHTPQSIARITRLPASVLEEAIPRLLEIGWLEVSDCNETIAHESAGIPQDTDATVPESSTSLREGDTEGKGSEVKGSFPAQWDPKLGIHVT